MSTKVPVVKSGRRFNRDHNNSKHKESTMNSNGREYTTGRHRYSHYSNNPFDPSNNNQVLHGHDILTVSPTGSGPAINDVQSTTSTEGYDTKIGRIGGEEHLINGGFPIPHGATYGIPSSSKEEHLVISTEGTPRDHYVQLNHEGHVPRETALRYAGGEQMTHVSQLHSRHRKDDNNNDNNNDDDDSNGDMSKSDREENGSEDESTDTIKQNVHYHYGYLGRFTCFKFLESKPKIHFCCFKCRCNPWHYVFMIILFTLVCLLGLLFIRMMVYFITGTMIYKIGNVELRELFCLGDLAVGLVIGITYFIVYVITKYLFKKWITDLILVASITDNVESKQIAAKHGTSRMVYENKYNNIEDSGVELESVQSSGFSDSSSA